MKKIRYIPYGYTMRNGRIVIDHEEAEYIQYIFEGYIKGASLKELADELTRRKIPYTEKTTQWDKARIARIIENSRYIGAEEYDPIIEERLYDEAMRTKASRQRSHIPEESEEIRLIKNRVRCAKCGALMERRICSKRKIPESWNCTNPECGLRVRISDTDLLNRLTILINRIIENADLMLPEENAHRCDSVGVRMLQEDIDAELKQEYPSEGLIILKLQEIASELYQNTQASRQIAARNAKQRVSQMHPTETFSGAYFSDIVETVLLDASGRLTIRTKTENEISEGE